MKVVGLDVCRGSVVACLLSKKPTDPREFYDECEFYYFKADASGIKALLALNPDVAILEPTGVNYSKIWGTYLARAGVEVRLVGHSQLKRYRPHLGFNDKKDETDALSLACYYFDYKDSPRRFVQIRDREIVRIREIVLRLSHLNRCENPLINRLRQDLAWQFPEIAKTKCNRNGGQPPLLLAWLAGEQQSQRHDCLYARSVGLGLTDSVRFHARRLCDLHREEIQLEDELMELVQSDERFAPYLEVFEEFGFGDRVSAILLSQIHPLENFLGEDNQPIVLHRKSAKGKPSKRHKSRARFEKALGCAPREESSGEKESKRVVGGSSLCRVALWQWMFTRVEVRRSRQKFPICIAIGEEYDRGKANKVPIALLRSRLRAKVARLLFYRLHSILFGKLLD